MGGQDDLAVGADVDQQACAGQLGQARRQDSRHRVAADESADHRHHIGPAAGMNSQADFGGLHPTSEPAMAGTNGTSPR